MSLASFLLLLLSAFVPSPHENAARQPAVDTTVRPCSASSQPAKSSNAQPKKHARQRAPESPSTTACAEIHSTAIDIQEFVQSFVRDQRWSVHDQHAAESALSFVRDLDTSDLRAFAKIDTGSTVVNWNGGTAFVQIRTAELEAGFVRVEIDASFEGTGENADKFAPPKTSWKLPSNGSLENSILSALQTHFSRSLNLTLRPVLQIDTPAKT